MRSSPVKEDSFRFVGVFTFRKRNAARNSAVLFEPITNVSAVGAVEIPVSQDKIRIQIDLASDIAPFLAKEGILTPQEPMMVGHLKIGVKVVLKVIHSSVRICFFKPSKHIASEGEKSARNSSHVDKHALVAQFDSSNIGLIEPTNRISFILMFERVSTAHKINRKMTEAQDGSRLPCDVGIQEKQTIFSGIEERLGQNVSPHHNIAAIGIEANRDQVSVLSRYRQLLKQTRGRLHGKLAVVDWNGDSDFHALSFDAGSVVEPILPLSHFPICPG